MTTEQDRHNRMLKVLFGNLFKGDFLGIDPKDIPEIIELGYNWNEELYQIAVDMGRRNTVSLDDLEGILGEFNRRNDQLPRIHEGASKGVPENALQLPQGFGKKELGKFNQLMSAIYDTLGKITENHEKRFRGEDIRHYPHAENFSKKHKMLLTSVRSSMSNLDEADRRHFQERNTERSETNKMPDQKLPRSEHDRPSVIGRGPNRGVASAEKFGILNQDDRSRDS